MHSLPSIKEAARVLGGEANGSGVVCPGPGHGPKDRSLSVRFEANAPDGFLVTSFAGDDFAACRDHVRDRLGLDTFQPSRQRPSSQLRAARPTPVETRQDDPELAARIERARAIWNAAGELRGTLGESYLRSRGLEVGENLAHVLRFSPALSYKGETAAGVVALFRDALSGQPCGIHRIFLDRDGRKLERMMLGRTKGAAIMLDAYEDVTLGLHIGEGIETCLAARAKDYRPAWAMGSVGAIASFPVLQGLEGLTVFAENGSASAQAAHELCERYWAARIETFVCEPPVGDFNDLTK
jgi:Toprim domain